MARLLFSICMGLNQGPPTSYPLAQTTWPTQPSSKC